MCDEGYSVKFSKEKCEVLNSKLKIVMLGTKLSNNCYHWDKTNQELKCNLSRLVETILWHYQLGHANMSKIYKTQKQKLCSDYHH